MRSLYLLVITSLIITSQTFAQSIATQPSNTSVCLGSSATFTSTVTGAPTFITWKVSTNGGTTWNNASGSVTNSSGTSKFTISSVSNSNVGLYRVAFTFGSTTLTSNSATLSLNQPADKIVSASPSSVCMGSGSNIILTNPASNVTYQLRNNSNDNLIGVAQSTSSASTLTFPTGNLTSTTTYNILATNSSGCKTEMSVTPTVTVNSFPANKSVSAPSSVCYGTSANISVSNIDRNVSYQLMNSADNSVVGTAQSGNNNATLTFNTDELESTTSFYILATNQSGCSAVMTTKPTITINSLPSVTVNANYCYGGGKIQLTASSTMPSTYLWSNGVRTQSILVDIASNYTVTATATSTGCQSTSSRAIAHELVTNGDFSAGNTGFTTGYDYAPDANALVPEGLYSVNNDAHYSHPNFWGKDHTTGNGNFMVVNGSPISDQPTVWEQTVTVTPNTTYYFAAWAVSLNTVGNYAQLRFSINGTQIGTTAALDPGPASSTDTSKWVRFYGTWNSGSATTARIYIIDNQTIRSGNDFGLDDISFATLAPEAFTASITDNINGSVCEGGSINFTTTLKGGLSPFTYAWSGPNSFTSSIKDPAITTSSPLHSGVYTLSVTDGFGCPVVIKDTVVINALPISKTISAQASTICSGTSTNIQIANSEAGINYKLRNASNSIIGSGVNGNGSATAINLPTGNLTASTTFNVLAVNNTTGCSRQMSNTAPITVNPNATISLTSASSTNTQTLCINSAIINITYTIGGGATSAGVTGLPTGVTGTLSGSTFTISGIPNISGTFNYSVTTTGTCAQISATGTITVKPNAAISLSSAPSTNAQTACINSAITNITYTIGGATNASVTGLPSGVTGSFNGGTFTISGTPTVTGSFNYTVTTIGTCVQTSTTGSITVKSNATITLSSALATDAQSICFGNSITDIKYTIGGGGTGAVVIGLPAGVTGSYNAGIFTISGTPSAIGTFPYFISTTGICAQTFAAGSITVKPNATITLTSAPSTNAQTVCINSGITNIKYSVGGSATNATVSGLPTGVSSSFNGSTLTISGTPSVAGTFNYTVTTTGTCSQVSATGSIMVTPNATITLTSVASTNAQILCLNSTITNIIYTIGGSATSANVTGLPAGVTGSLNGSTLIISGIPSVSGTFNYIVTTSGTCTQASATGTITVKPNATISLTSNASTNAQTLCVNSSIANIVYAIGGGATGASVTGLPSGVTGSLSGSTLTISGTPSATGTYNYNVSTTGSCTQASATGTITVKPNATISLTSAPSTNAQTICNNSSITNIVYTIGGGATSANITGLPSGVTGSFSGSTLTISGTPSAAGIFNYTITTSGTCSQASANGTIIVKPSATISLTSAASTNAQTPCINSTITNIVYTIGGGATSASVTGLPAGVNSSLSGSTLTIGGTPTVSGNFNYTVTTTGTCTQVSASGTIAVNAQPTLANVTVPTICANSSATIVFSGMVPNSTNNTISYKLNGIAQSPLTGINADASGNAAFNTPVLTQANNGQVVEFTGVANGSCSKSFSKTITLNITTSGTWLGVSTNWFDANNWCGGVPSITTNVIIPVVASNIYPVISGTTKATTNNITIAANASLTVNDGTIQIAGVIANSGIFRAGNGSVEMKSSIAQTIPAHTFAGDSLKNLVISNTSAQGVTLGGGVNLYGTLSFGNNNNQVLVSNGYLNLKSTPNGTAKVGDLSNNNTNTNNKVIGDVVVERYYPARRSWRLITAPVSSKRSIFNSWQVGGGHTNDINHTAPANSGTYITSAKPGPGLDKSRNYSLDSFDIATGKLVGINNTMATAISDSSVNPGTKMDNKGYFIFVRGDRTPSNINPDATRCNITTLRDTGALQTYTKKFTANLTSKNLFMLLANPYASPVDFGKLTKSSNILNKFWAWDPRLNEKLGSYVLVDGMIGSTYITVPYNSNFGKQDGVNQDQNIQSGQAVYIQSGAPGVASVTFEESSKSLLNNNVFRPVNVTEGATQALRTNLYLVNPDTTILADGIYAQYDNGFSNDIDLYDAVKFSNSAENLGIVKYDKTLILERRPLLNNNDTVFFKLWNTTARNYRLEFMTDGLNRGGLQGYLEDSYLKTSTPINMDGVSVVDFNINSAAASKATDRFRIVFKTLSALPVSFNKVKAYQQNSNINVEWTMENEANMKQYEVERSTDGHSFTKVTTAIAKQNNNSSVNYQWVDANVTNGTYFYRIVSISKNGESHYSSIVKVNIGGSISQIAVYPNPVVNGTINLQLVNQPKGNYTLKLTNKLGQLIMKKDVQHEAGSSTETLQLSETMPHGTYQLEVSKPGNDKTTINVLY